MPRTPALLSGLAAVLLVTGALLALLGSDPDLDLQGAAAPARLDGGEAFEGRRAPQGPIIETERFAGAPDDEVARAVVFPVVRVVDENDAPVEGARVAWHRRDGASAAATLTRGSELSPHLRGRPAYEVRSDASGLAVWPPEHDRGRWTVVAEAGELAMQADWALEATDDAEQRAAPVIKLTLRGRRDLSIVVVDESERPVPDAIVVVYAPAARTYAPSWMEDDMSGFFQSFLTGADGRAHVRLLDHEAHSSLARSNRLRFHVLQLGGQPVDVDIEGEALDQEIRLRTEAMCRVHITVEDVPWAYDRRQLQRGTKLTLAHGEQPRGATIHVNFGGMPPAFETVAKSMLGAWAFSPPRREQAYAIFRRGAPVGWRLECSGREDGGASWTVPDAEQGNLVVRPGQGLTTFTLRAVTEDGMPLKASWYRPVRDDDSVSRSFDQETATWSFQRKAGSDGAIVIRPNTRGPVGEEVLARVALPPHVPGQTIDLGEVVLPVPGLFVRGRVEDHLRRPIAGALVKFVPTGDGWLHMSLRAGLPTSWRTDEQGEFTIRRWDLEAPLEHRDQRIALRVDSDGFSSDPVTFEVGSTVVLSATQTGGIAGRIRISRSLEEHLYVSLESEVLHTAETVIRSDGGVFEEKNLPPGVYTMRVELADTEVHRFEGIRVLPGDVTRPAHLQDLLVGEGFQPARVTVLDGKGEPATGIAVRVGYGPRGLAGQIGPGFRTDDRGHAEVIVRKGDDLVVLIEAPQTWGRHQPKMADLRIEAPEFPLTVRMKPIPQVVLHLDRHLPPSPTGSWRLILRRPLDVVEQDEQRERVERLRSNPGLSDERRASLRVPTHDVTLGSRGEDVPEKPIVFRFGDFLRVGAHEIHIAPTRRRGDPEYESLRVGTLDVHYGAQEKHLSLGESVMKQMRASYPL